MMLLDDAYVVSVVRSWGTQSDEFSDLLDARSLVHACHRVAADWEGREMLLRVYAYLEVEIHRSIERCRIWP
jgi:hypothetical protein